MKLFQRGAGIALLLALYLVPAISIAQTDQTIRAAGSGVVTPLLERLFAASEADAELSINIEGTQAGFVSFCQGEADLTTATRPISIEEESNCTANGVEYAELLIGHNILALIAHPDLLPVQCLSLDAIDSLFAPSSSGQIIDWTQINLNTTEPINTTPLSVILPPDTTATYALLDALANGVGLRTDIMTQPDDSALVQAVNDTPGAIGAVTLQAALTYSGRLLALNTAGLTDPSADASAGCFAPSAENVETQRYSSADRLFVYVNRTSLEKAGLSEALSFAASQQAASAVEEAGFTAPTADAYTLNQTILSGESSGRQFSLEVVEFEIPANIAGTFTIGGAGLVGGYLNTASTQFTSIYSGTTATVQIDGQAAGARRMCNGELDIAAIVDTLTDEQAANCAANNITTVPIAIGAQAAVLVANADPQYTSDYLACLTVEQVQQAWRTPAVGGEDIVTWNQVDPEFPEVTMILFAAEGSNIADILLKPAEGIIPAIREDIEFDADPLYRAAATANVEGAMALLTWQEYQDVLANNQERIQLVSVNGGEGCVAPSEASFLDGTYPFAQQGTLLVKQTALTRPEVQSFLWYLFSDENYVLLENAGFTGIAFDALPDQRNTLQTLFAQAQVALLEVGLEVTPEATAEGTPSPDISVEPTAEATPEATSAQ